MEHTCKQCGTVVEFGDEDIVIVPPPTTRGESLVFCSEECHQAFFQPTWLQIAVAQEQQ